MLLKRFAHMPDSPSFPPPSLEGPAVSRALGNLRLDELLGELQDRLTEVVETRDRLQGLLDAVLDVGAGLELDTTLNRIVGATSELVQARYGALGVLGPEGEFARLIHVGIDDETLARMGPLPDEHGLLGRFLREGQTLRLPDLTQHPESVGTPDEHPAMRSLLGTPIRVRGELFGSLFLTEKIGGGEFTADDEIVLRALAAAAGVAVENARLFEQAKLRHRWLEASSEITTELLSGVSTADALRLIAQRALEIAQADCALIVFARQGSSDGQARVEAVAGDVDIQTGLPLATDGPVLGDSLTGDTPVLTSDISRQHSGSLYHLLPNYGPALAVPLRSDEAPAGAVIALREKGRPPFVREQVPLLASFAGQTAVALEFAAKNRAQRRLDVIGDRDRIARDLHDHVIQRLFATGLGLQSALQRVDDDDVRQRLDKSLRQLDDTVREIRTSIFNLHAETNGAEQVGLRRRLLNIIADASDGSEVSPSVRMSGPIDTAVPATYFEHAEAVVREAVSNAIRHGNATEIIVVVESSEDLVVDVTDNGRGIGRSPARSGLRNLHDRALQCAGSLTVSPADTTGGTRLRWQVPLTPNSTV